MFATIQFAPGAILAGVAINLPSAAPKIDAITSAYILRPTSQIAISDHAAAAVIAAIDDHAAVDVIASIDDHPVHGHNITMVVAAGGGGAVTAPAIPGPLESAGGAATMTGAVDALAAAQAHAATATAVAHAASATAVAHTLTGASPVVAAVATKSDEDTITLNVPTVAGDLLVLSYIVRGARLAAA